MLDMRMVPLGAVGIAALLGFSFPVFPAGAQETDPGGSGGGAVEVFETTTEIVHPTFPGAAVDAATPDWTEAARLHDGLLDLRESIATRNTAGFESLPGAPLAPSGLDREPAGETVETKDVLLLETPAGSEQGLGLEDPSSDSLLFDETLPAETLVVTKNTINDITPTSPQFRSSLGETAIANLGRRVFYTGNTFASFSRDGGTTWLQRNLPAPPFAGAIMCCDQDVVYSEARKRVFWSMLWLNDPRTRGSVQIAVLKRPTRSPACVYNIGFGNSTVPDYPHIGLSNDFLYLTTNNITDDSWSGSQVKRFPLDQMAECESAPAETFTWSTRPQRVFVPVEGATETMYWGMLDNSTRFRIFSWPETTDSVSSVTRTITTSPHNNPDCRGGVGNNDFIERSTSWSISGFRMRGWYGQPNKGGGTDAVGWMWNVGTDAEHPQGHIHAAVFDADSLDLIGEPHIWSSDFCYGYPDVTTTERGHPAVVLAYGGREGGGGSAANNAVLLGDDVAGDGPFGPHATVAEGTHNREDGRFGDYFTIGRHSPCHTSLIAASYVLSGGNSGSNTEHHYLSFGRNRDTRCFDFWDAR